MRRILVERARQNRAAKRGGDCERVGFDDLPHIDPGVDLVVLDDALQVLAERHPEKARLVTLRYFGGFSLEEAAEILAISRATAQRHWAYARAWLLGQLRQD
jgi:RNA polymerase sigma factor (TIGR02999 family)